MEVVAGCGLSLGCGFRLAPHVAPGGSAHEGSEELCQAALAQSGRGRGNPATAGALQVQTPQCLVRYVVRQE